MASLLAQLLSTDFDQRMPGLPPAAEVTSADDGDDDADDTEHGPDWEPHDDDLAEEDYTNYLREFPLNDPRD